MKIILLKTIIDILELIFTKYYNIFKKWNKISIFLDNLIFRLKRIRCHLIFGKYKKTSISSEEYLNFEVNDKYIKDLERMNKYNMIIEELNSDNYGILHFNFPNKK